MNNALSYFQNFIGQRMTKENTPSAVGAWLNGKLIDVSEGKMRVEFEVKKEWLNPLGMLHGGIIALIADEIIGATVFSLGLEKQYVGINLNVNFLKSSKLNDIIFAEAEVLKKGRKLISSNCLIKNSKGDILATISGNNMGI